MFSKAKTKSTAKAEIITHHGHIQHSFLSPEFLDYHRGPLWYIVAVLISIAVIAVGILTKAITLTIAFLLLIAIYWLLHHRQAGLIEVAITQHGIRHDNDFYPFGEIEEYWIVDKPPFVSDLKIRLKRKINSVVTIHIFGQDPLALRTLLEPHADENKDRDEAFVDLLARALRL